MRSNLEFCARSPARARWRRSDDTAEKGSSVRAVVFTAAFLVTAVSVTQHLDAQSPPAAGQAPQRATSSAPMPSSTPFLGGVPAGQPSAGMITITILDAMSRALEHNLGVLNAEQQLGRAGGARWRAL